jgi:hypothetical protein
LGYTFRDNADTENEMHKHFFQMKEKSLAWGETEEV